MGFKSAYRAGHDISGRKCCSTLLLMYLWQSLLICFGSLSGMSTNPWATRHISDRIAWRCSKLWYPIWFNFPFIGYKSLILQLAKAPITKRATPPRFPLGVIQGVAALSRIPHHMQCSYLTVRFRTLIRAFKRHYSTVLLCSLYAIWSTVAFWLVLLSQQRFL